MTVVEGITFVVGITLAAVILIFVLIAVCFSLANKGYKTKAIWSDKKRTIFGLPISFTRYELYENKLITRKGFLNISEDEVELYRVVDKKLTQKLTERVFGLGTLTLNVRDVDTAIKVLERVKSPRHVADLIENYVDKERTAYSVRGRDMIGLDDCDCEK